ncbi:hypothetical protein SEMRO_2818_G337810.1 [Seminavis robusta]|uniref:Uncharacterized protein n=1 Tax=Seminavis robusta TaxID=568900 RepID=A0A9N8F2F9_9STRA|nr:hypothetical protein SEMRO_2818_G337810.1 [Seminavis robusta]|eukprot:Sro2818_g337810.1 n/a (156) ;mRNA; r:800-1450
MGSSVAKLLEFMTDELEMLRPPEQVVAVSPLTAANDRIQQLLNTPPRRQTRASGNEPEKVEWGFNLKTGYTPRRGRLTNKRVKDIEKKSHDDHFVKPKLQLQMSVYDPTIEEVKSAYVSNSCYLVHHKTAFDDFWKEKHGEEEADIDEDESTDDA